ncbi:2-hydroxyacid dehydrogenase [Puniceibacterium confluentis]|uniref:2-hydroxyacid dehydrogenase n=1 Tax=Puniceibacterium confluentis TaxID=1958944 RepID=UPI0011B662F9|nr:NAD(P)-dependent oxidoreductase [Puniceibacterium confluentis]
MSACLRLLVARPVPPAVARTAQSRFDATLADHNLSIEEVVSICREQQIGGILMGGNLHLDAAGINALPKTIRVIATTSIGWDHVDAVAAEARGITVTNVPDIGADCAADIAFMHILMCCRRAVEYDRLMREGWGRRLGFDEMLGRSVGHRRIGIVGMGQIGRLVARRARAFGMEVHFTDLQPPVAPVEGAIFHKSLQSLLPLSDVLTLHLPDLPATRGMIGAAELAQLPKGAILINAARGTLVDQNALIESLESGHLFAAGLDTFADEPQVDPRLRAMPNVSLTPHAGSATVETREGICLRCLDNIAAVLEGRPAMNPVNRQVFA